MNNIYEDVYIEVARVNVNQFNSGINVILTRHITGVPRAQAEFQMNCIVSLLLSVSNVGRDKSPVGECLETCYDSYHSIPFKLAINNLPPRDVSTTSRWWSLCDSVTRRAMPVRSKGRVQTKSDTLVLQDGGWAWD
jgi:hypothetical protein